MRIWAARVFIKSENFKLFGGVCFDGVFWLSILLMGIWGLVSKSSYMGFVVAWVDSKVFHLHLIGFDIGECGHMLVACQVFGKLPIWVRGSNFLTCVVIIIIWDFGCIHSCYYVLKHVILRLIKSESFLHDI